jgi:hypothetical protein
MVLDKAGMLIWLPAMQSDVDDAIDEHVEILATREDGPTIPKASTES